MGQPGALAVGVTGVIVPQHLTGRLQSRRRKTKTAARMAPSGCGVSRASPPTDTEGLEAAKYHAAIPPVNNKRLAHAHARSAQGGRVS